MLLITNADDLGTSAAINREVFTGMEQGVVTSATIIANAPAFEDAVADARSFPQCSFGVHLNLSVMAPLRPSPDLEPVLDAQGHLSVKTHDVKLTRALEAALERELVAQVERVLDAGLPITHFDSHQHVHVRPALFLMIKRLQQRFGIRRMRSTINIVAPSGRLGGMRQWKKRLFRLAQQRYYPTRMTEGLCEFRVFLACLSAGRLPYLGSIEVMVHPGAHSARYVEENAALFDGTWKSLLPPGARLGSYHDV